MIDDREGLLDLMAARATEGLPDEEATRLDAALRELPEVGSDDLELAAAAADRAFDAPLDDAAMPEDLKRRILEQASAYLPSRKSESE